MPPIFRIDSGQDLSDTRHPAFQRTMRLIVSGKESPGRLKGLRTYVSPLEQAGEMPSHTIYLFQTHRLDARTNCGNATASG